MHFHYPRNGTRALLLAVVRFKEALNKFEF